MDYEKWISLVMDRLCELGVPGDAVNKDIINAPWFGTLHVAGSTPSVAGDEYLRFDSWIRLVVARLIELGVPDDEVNEEILDRPWWHERFSDDALPHVTADEHFHWDYLRFKKVLADEHNSQTQTVRQHSPGSDELF